MDGMVTARVPAEVRERVNGMLREAGSSPTELVNAAYEYYLRCGELPDAGEDEPEELRIVLTKSQTAHVRERLEAARCGVPASFWKEGGPWALR